MYSRTTSIAHPPARPGVAPLRIVKSPPPQQPQVAHHHMHLHHRGHESPLRSPATAPSDPTPPPSPPSPRSPRSTSLHDDYHDYFDPGPNPGNVSPTSPNPPLAGPPPAPMYLRALHAFHPTAQTMSESDCLSFEPDQIIQVHTLHPSGWADGTLLATNERGWFPSNYCEQYTLSNLRPLLGASSLLYATVRAKRVSHYYTVISCVVTSVRGLLVSCNALSRDTELVKTEPEVRRARKHLLAELGVLASLAKKANQVANVPLTEETELSIDALGEAIQTRTERLVSRANRLLEIATPLTELWKEEDMYIPPTPPTSGVPQGATAFDFSTGGEHWEFATGIKAGVAPRQGSIATSGADSYGSTVSSSLSDDSLAAANSLPQSNWALDRLNNAHDVLLSHLAAYIGRLHLQSRSPGAIFDTTNQCVIAARNFLAVVRAITSRKGSRLSSTGALEQSSHVLWAKCTLLVNTAREVVSSHGVGESEDDVVVMDGEVRRLVEAATACVRSAGECSAMGHCLLEAIGDFELPSSAIKGNRESLMSFGSTEDYSRRISQSKHLSKQLPPPPPETEPGPRLPRNGSPTRKIPPKLNLVSSSYTTPRAPSSGPRSSGLRYSPQLSPGDRLKQRDAEAQSKFMATLPEVTTPSTPNPPSPDLETLNIPARPEIIEPSPSPPQPHDPHARQISHPQLRRESLFRSDSTEDALRAADTLLMPRTGSSSSSSVNEGEGAEEIKSVPTTPEPGTPVGPTHPVEIKTVVLNADGQVMGATLEGLVERLTLHDAPPDAILSNTFYITFRLFTTPAKLAETLVARFNIEPEPSTEDLAKWKRDVSTPVKLRVFNVFKGWMESHWRQETDAPALDLIVEFALGDLTRAFPQSGKRLDDLANKVSKAAGPLVPRQVSSMGKAGPSTPNFVMSDSPVPPAIMSKSLLATLKASALGNGSGPSITDFDPLEIARQFTIRESKIFCAVLPEELVGQAFQAGKRGSSAVNVKALSSLSSVMTAWVADSIMDDGADAKRRAQIIKHWIKVCQKCLSLYNYSSLYNIFCALESTSVQRLNKTWPLLSAKHKETMDTLRHLTDVARNHAVYRAELRQRVPPCLPFMGLYLTDLTFVDEGNLDTRPVPDAPEGSPPLINFNKHIQTAKIIADVQRFQIPYRLQEVPEIQGWMEAQLARTKQAGSLDSMKLYRRSLAIEPREAPQLNVEGVASGQSSRRGSADDTNSPFSPLFTAMARERSSGGKLPTVQEEKRDNWTNNKI